MSEARRRLDNLRPELRRLIETDPVVHHTFTPYLMGFWTYHDSLEAAVIGLAAEAEKHRALEDTHGHTDEPAEHPG